MSRNNPDDFDPMAMHMAFEKTIKDLKAMNIKMEKKVNHFVKFIVRRIKLLFEL